MSEKRELKRSSQDVMLAGVCGGIAEFFNLPVTNVRILYFIATLFSVGLGIVVYIGLAIIVPQTTEY
ncbi:MAG: PspC domain-containing protein [Cellulosilyticaceae bacterium]